MKTSADPRDWLLLPTPHAEEDSAVRIICSEKQYWKRARREHKEENQRVVWGHGRAFLHIFLCFDTKSLRPVISMWPEGESPTKVIAISEVDELKTSLPIAPGLDVSGDDEFLHEVRCTLNPRSFECQARKGTGSVFSLFTQEKPMAQRSHSAFGRRIKAGGSPFASLG